MKGMVQTDRLKSMAKLRTFADEVY